MKVLGLSLVVLLISVHGWSATATDVSISDVYLQAVSDASRDIIIWDIWAYLGAGVSVCLATGMCMVATGVDSRTNDLFLCMSVSGSVAAVLSVGIGIYGSPSNPPPERLIGKSPEYVRAYAHAYKARIRSERTTRAIAAPIFGCLVIGLLSSM